ncbi:TonB-dependent receptor [uncultured Spirosoma sp.]|uniref:TonB-dependent receptor n=1 Tax=uncultured Spirosoma sp. TaxID=278208 RepID=UPI00258840D0|nr:TonB-dependent receptor [uncultured Spirosoma sp.]
MKLLLYAFLLLAAATAQAATLRGTVTDGKTGEPLIGATLQLMKNGTATRYGGVVGLDGQYHINDVPAGSYVLRAHYISYQTMEKAVVVGAGLMTTDFALPEASRDLAEVVVSGSDREGDRSVRKAEQKADNVLNIIGAKAIQLLPDITVGNVLQRISGVSVVRNATGDGQFAVIRGMDKRYNYTLVNGIKIPSPDNKNRYVPMDIFPADLLERLEVVKALTPSMEGDAIGGAMNMIMKSAPNHLTVSATASGGYSQLFSSQPFSGFSTAGTQFKSPSERHGNQYAAQPSDFSVKPLQYRTVSFPVNGLFSLSVGNRLLNRRLGFMLGGSYQHTYRGSNSLFFRLNGQPGPDPVANTPIFEMVEKRTYSNEQGRLGLNLKLDYVFNERHKLNLYGLFMQLDDKQHRNIYGNQLTQYGDVSITDRSVFRRQNVANVTLQGDHKLTDRLTMNWSAVQSLAISQTPDWVDQSLTYRTAPDAEGKPVASAIYIDPVTHYWTHNQDRDLTGYLNLTYALSPSLELATGGLYRAKNRSNFFNDYTLATVLPGGDRQVFAGIDKAIFSFRPESYAYADSTNGNNYTAQERIAAGYVQAKVTLPNQLQLLGGLRAEQTQQAYDSQIPVTATGKSGTISYLDLLPSLHLKYPLSSRANLRLSYFRGISRPGYFELVPAMFPGDYFSEQGNYALKHTVADNIDLRYELFAKNNDQLLIGGFAKNIKNPIEYGFNQFTNNTYVYVPLNFGTAVNYGAELVFAKYINQWGVSGNYTYTHSRITTSKRVYGRDASGNIVNSIENQTRPLQGQSDHIANLSLIYKSVAHGFDAQLSWVYTGRRINIVSPYKDLDYWQRGTSQVDLSAEKRFGGHFSVFGKFQNLLNNPVIVEVMKPNNLGNLPEQTRPDRILVQKDAFGQTYILGLRYRH